MAFATILLSALSAESAACAQQYSVTNIVSSGGSSISARVTDSRLAGPWGLARSDSSPWWIADLSNGLSTIYRGDGTINPLTVTVPKGNPTYSTSKPAGVIYAGYPEFQLTPGNTASFFFSTIDGTIAGWNPETGLGAGQVPPSTKAVTVVQTTDGSDYTGLAAATIGGKPYLYAANFSRNRIDVYDSSFHAVVLSGIASSSVSGPHVESEAVFHLAVAKSFYDPLLPANFAPYNIATIGNDLVVTYAPQSGTAGPGQGYVDVYSSSGSLLQRLQHGAWMNAPWGVALAPTDFGTFSHDLLIAQTGLGFSGQNSGTIAAFDLVTGAFVGQLEDLNGVLLAIPGLRGISVASGMNSGSPDPSGTPAAEVFFTAAPDHATSGLLGYLTALSLDLNNGGDQ